MDRPVSQTFFIPNSQMYALDLWNQQRMHMLLSEALGGHRRDTDRPHHLHRFLRSPMLPGVNLVTVTDKPLNKLPWGGCLSCSTIDVDALSEESTLNFDVVVCAEHRSRDENGRTIATPMTDPQDVKDWFTARASGDTRGMDWGFQPIQLNVLESEGLRVDKDGSQFYINAVHLVGVLKVTNKAAFQHSLRRGIGRKKPYGCGLLFVSRNN